MNTIKKIVCPVDLSPNAQNALRYALKIADQWKASIEVVHVVYPQAEGLDFPVMVATATQNLIANAQSTLTTWIETTIAQVQINYEFQEVPSIHQRVEVGTPIRSIIEVAKDSQADLVIMGAKGKHNVFERFIGTVSGEVIQRPPCPVLLIPDVCDFKPINRFTYATTLTAKDPYYIWKTTQILKPFSPVVDCVHIQNNQQERTAIHQEDLNLFFNYTMPELQLRVFNVESHEITTTLDSFTETYRSDLLVMFKPKENLVQRLFFESTTKKMALMSKTPLLVIV